MTLSLQLKIEIVSREGADALLAQDAFIAEWTRLQSACPWATGFQSPAFALAWYRAYRSKYDPWLVISRDTGGRLQGLLALARAAGGRGDFFAAGHSQAEYQCWICAPALGDIFPAAAMRAIRAEAPRASLRFEFLPPGAPVAWVDDPETKGLAVLITHRRPLMRFGDGSEVAQSLRKSGNKSRLRQLQKLGPMQFKRVTDPAEFEADFAQVMRFYDARHLGMRGASPFADDACKRPFHLEMMKTPGLLHVTVLKFGDQLACAHLGVASPMEVELGLVAHNPRMAKLSPGKFHILLLAQMLHGEGYQQLDLTCGGESYKERFANAWDEVRTLSLVPSRAHGAIAAARERVKEKVKETLRRRDLMPARVISQLTDLKRIGIIGVTGLTAAHARRWLASRSELRIYSRIVDAESTGVPENLHRDSVADLLAYAPPRRSGPSRQAFMSVAFDRLEEGHHVYTTLDDTGALAHVGSLADELPDNLSKEIAGAWSPQSDSVIVFDIGATNSSPARSKELTSNCLRAMLNDAAVIHKAKTMHVLVGGDDVATRAVVEEAGFLVEQVVIEEITMGRRKRRATLPIAPAPTPPVPSPSLDVSNPKPPPAKKPRAAESVGA
jgi:CelD/BcsL family acetyltransferase involved in cellulose biosynthesis